MATLAHAAAGRRLVHYRFTSSRYRPLPHHRGIHSSPRCDDLAALARGQAGRKPGLYCALLEIARGLP